MDCVIVKRSSQQLVANSNHKKGNRKCLDIVDTKQGPERSSLFRKHVYKVVYVKRTRCCCVKQHASFGCGTLLSDTLICAGHWVLYIHCAIAGPTAHMGNSRCGTEQVIGDNGTGSAFAPLLRCA